MGGAGADDEAITVVRVAEPEIGATVSARLQSLLQTCFPGYPDRSYFKLPPHLRYLVMTSDGDVVAQMGVEFRVIRVGDSVLRTFGVVDLCVADSERSRGLAADLGLGDADDRDGLVVRALAAHNRTLAQASPAYAWSPGSSGADRLSTAPATAGDAQNFASSARSRTATCDSVSSPVRSTSPVTKTIRGPTTSSRR